MSLPSQAWSAILLGLVTFPILSAGGDGRDRRHRVPLAVPVSTPFTVTEAMRLPEWGQLRRMTQLLRTDRGTLELLHGMPKVEARYADESHFLELVRKWRDRVPVLPEQPRAADEEGSSWVVLDNGQARTISITFRDPAPENSLTVLRITWVGQEVTNLSFASSFERVLPPRNRHWEHRGWVDAAW